MDNGRRQINMPHPFSSNTRMGNFYSASITYNPFMFYSFIFSAKTFPIAFRSKNAFTEQTIFFCPVRSIINRFRLFYFAIRPASDIFRGCERYFHRTIFINFIVHDICHFRILPITLLKLPSLSSLISSSNPSRQFR